MIINVLGTDYTISYKTSEEDKELLNCGGYCSYISKNIVIDADEPHYQCSEEEKAKTKQKYLRHELVHAFLSESGLAENSPWAQNEELVDWIAIQGEKIVKAWKEAGAL